MCQGHQVVPVYRPFTADMLPHLQGMFPNLTQKWMVRVHEVMTDGFHPPTLALVTLLGLVENFLKGNKNAVAFDHGFGIQYSALTKDNTGRMQTADMKLLHDVMTTLPMAEANIAGLQTLLGSQGAMFVSFHSCGQAVIYTTAKEQFYADIRPTQLLRTGLDATTPVIEGTCADVIRRCNYTSEEASFARLCVARAQKLVDLVPPFELSPDQTTEQVAVAA